MVIHRCCTAILCLAVMGCGGVADQPNLGRVTGVVTLNGQPLPDANVEFEPEDGRPSTAVTNESGEYELDYSRDAKGAKIGKHTVRITTFQEGDDPESVVEEKVPTVYNSDTTLTETVESGSQEIDFELDSNAGPVKKPSETEDEDGGDFSC